MGSRDFQSLRSLPRVFVPGADASEPIELPIEEIDKLRKVLRLSPGAKIAVLPNDGSIVRCEFQTRHAIPLEVAWPDSEPKMKLTLAQALPKGDKLDEIVRACTEIGVSRFILFPSERTVVRWDAKKTGDRLRRLETIAREAAEVCFRTKLPTIEMAFDLKEVLKKEPEAAVLSEAEGNVGTVGRRRGEADDRGGAGGRLDSSRACPRRGSRGDAGPTSVTGRSCGCSGGGDSVAWLVSAWNSPTFWAGGALSARQAAQDKARASSRTPHGP